VLTTADKTRRALDAERLLNEPLLNEVLDDIERSAIEQMLAVGAIAISEDDDRKRRQLADRANAVRGLRNALHSIIKDGIRAAEQPEKWG